jgi:hypothetical protein
MSGSESASKEVVVEGSDIAGVTLVMSAGVTARGRIVFDSGKPPEGLRPSQVFVTDVPVGPRTEGRMMAGALPVAQDDWTFELPGLRGREFIRASTLDGEWQVKRMRREDVDVTDTPLDLSNDIDNLEIELTQRVTTVAGGVSDEHNAPVLDATVVVFADDAAKWGAHSRFIASARLDQQGRFTIHGLPPGTYVAIAVGYLEPGEERDPDLLQDWRSRGTRFTLGEGETHALDLKLSGA